MADENQRLFRLFEPQKCGYMICYQMSIEKLEKGEAEALKNPEKDEENSKGVNQKENDAPKALNYEKISNVVRVYKKLDTKKSNGIQEYWGIDVDIKTYQSKKIIQIFLGDFSCTMQQIYAERKTQRKKYKIMEILAIFQSVMSGLQVAKSLNISHTMLSMDVILYNTKKESYFVGFWTNAKIAAPGSLAAKTIFKEDLTKLGGIFAELLDITEAVGTEQEAIMQNFQDLIERMRKNKPEEIPDYHEIEWELAHKILPGNVKLDERCNETGLYLKIRKDYYKSLGEKGGEIIQIARKYFDIGNFQEAFLGFSEALENAKKSIVVEEEAVEVLKTYIAYCHCHLGEKQKAVSLFEEIYQNAVKNNQNYF